MSLSPDSESDSAAPRGKPGALPTADLAPTGRAKCIGCETAIPARSIRIAVERQIDTGRFVTNGAGYLHPACVAAWASREDKDLAELIAQVKAHSALPELPAPFGSAAAEPVPAAALAAAAKKEAVLAQELPPFDGMTEKAIRDLAKKLDKVFDPNGFKHSDLLEKAGVAWGRRHALFWYLTEHQLVASEKNSGMLRQLVESLGEAPKGVVVPLLGRLTATIRDLYRSYEQGTLILPRWVRDFDALAVHALRAEREALEAAMDTLPADIRLGVAFVRGRSGLPIAEDDRKAIFKQLVQVALTQDAAVYFDINVVKGDQVERAFELNGPALLPRLAALFIAGEEAWAKALEAGLARGTWTTVAQVAAGLRRVPLDKLVALVGKRDYLDRDPGALFAVLDARGDSIEDVLQSALALPSDYQGGSRRILRELLLVWGLSRRAARAEAVATELASELQLELLPDSLREPARHPLRDGYLAVMRALPRADALALARRQLTIEYRHHSGLPILAAHFDAGLLREFVDRAAKDHYLRLESMLLIGEAALPVLVEAYHEMQDVKARDTVLAPLIALLGQQDGPLSATEQAAVTALGAGVVDCCDEQSYWSSERRDATERLLKRLPPAQRREYVSARLQQATNVDRPYRFVALDEDRAYRVAATRVLASRAATLTDEGNFETAVRAFGPGAPAIFAEALGKDLGTPTLLRRLESTLGSGYAELAAARGLTRKSWLENLRDMCTEAGGGHQRIYLLEPPYRMEGCGLEPRPGSWSRLGGAGVGGVPVPKRKNGEPLEHVLTIDLTEAPELAARYKDARALALYVPDPRSGEDYGDSELVAIPQSATAATTPSDGEPLFVLPVDVPRAIFDRRDARSNPVLGEVRKAIFNRSGWALGAPMWIQEPEGDDDLVMQLSEGLGINVGDCGSLYVFDYAIVMQSH